MKKIIIATILILLFGIYTYSQTDIPNTASGIILQKAVTAINTGNINTVKTFISENHSQRSIDFFGEDELFEMYYGIYDISHGLDFYRLIESSERKTVAVFRCRLTDAGYQFGVTMDSKLSNKIIGLSTLPLAYTDENIGSKKISDDEIVKKLQSIMNGLEKGKVFSGVVLLARENKIIFNEAYGWEKHNPDIPASIYTKFNLASVGKMFTGIAIAQLCEKGILSYEDPIGKFLGEEWIPVDVGENVKIKHLLSHTSGIGGGDFAITYVEEAVKNGYKNIDDYKDLSVNIQLDFDPGEKFDYSNMGYHLLGAIIEKVTGNNYFSYLKSQIFEPAEMTNAGFPLTNSNLESMAVGYEKVYEKGTLVYKDNRKKNRIKGSPAGSGYATSTDLFHFTQAIKNNKLVTQETKNILFTPKKELNSPRYGYGFKICSLPNGSTRVYHTGGYVGINNVVSMDLDNDITLIILSNLDNISYGACQDMLSMMIYEIFERTYD